MPTQLWLICRPPRATHFGGGREILLSLSFRKYNEIILPLETASVDSLSWVLLGNINVYILYVYIHHACIKKWLDLEC